jgi:hypothetical protein
MKQEVVIFIGGLFGALSVVIFLLIGSISQSTLPSLWSRNPETTTYKQARSQRRGRNTQTDMCLHHREARIIWVCQLSQCDLALWKHEREKQGKWTTLAIDTNLGILRK